MLSYEGGDDLARGIQRSCGCPWVPGSVQTGWDLEQLGTGVPRHGSGWNEISLKGLPTQTSLWYCADVAAYILSIIQHTP